MRRIAVICSGSFFVNWSYLIHNILLEEKQTIKEMNMLRRSVITEEGNIYIIVSSSPDIKDSEWDDYVVSPTYMDLISEVKSRIRK